MGVSFNNAPHSDGTKILSTTHANVNTWYNVTANVNLSTKKVEVFLGTNKIINHTLPSNFVLNAPSSDYKIMLSNNSVSVTFHGLIDNLKIYNGSAPPSQNPNYSVIQPTPTQTPTPTPTPTPVSYTHLTLPTKA